MLLNFSLNETENLYKQLYRQIKIGIEDGVLKKGERLPSVREAASQLGISRTTVENAYTRLCIEGFCESIPQKGYFIIGAPKKDEITLKPKQPENPIIFDFSSRFIDAKSADTALWKKLMRSVLWDESELNSYGEAQGEYSLRLALSEYAFKARGVIARPENIIVGAGMGPLLNILCGLLKKDITVGLENGGFQKVERIFEDYGIKTLLLESDSSGATQKSVLEEKPDVLFLLPSSLSKISVSSLSNRRNFYNDWVSGDNRLIIEDDYNGELRYTARSIPAFQSKNPQNTVYIGSFSKLLLPSVRIAFMVLPDKLTSLFKELSGVYNQTCGKIEQLTLEKYISSGALEKHLRKLRRLYYSKSQILYRALKSHLEAFEGFTLFESSLTAEIKLNRPFNPQRLYEKALKSGIKLDGVSEYCVIRLCFGGIPEENIENGVIFLNKILKNM